MTILHNWAFLPYQDKARVISTDDVPCAACGRPVKVVTHAPEDVAMIPEERALFEKHLDRVVAFYRTVNCMYCGSGPSRP